MVNLAINVDHVATLRQARGIDEPDPVLAAGICELAGAQGIVVHLREDRRHIQDRDVRILRETVKTKLNLEMGAAKEIIDIALAIKPDGAEAAAALQQLAGGTLPLTPPPESELEQKSVEKKINRKLFLLFTNQQQILSLMIKNNQLMMEILLYGDKDEMD